MVRTRVVQTLFAYYKDTDKTLLTARKELNKSFADTYDLYFMLLAFANELTAYAQQQLEDQQARAKATHSDWKPNKRFVNNRLAQQLFVVGHEALHLLAGLGGLGKRGRDGLLAAVKPFQQGRPAPFDEDEGQNAERDEHPDGGAQAGINQGIVHILSFSLV